MGEMTYKMVRLTALALALVVVVSCGNGQEIMDESSPSWSPDGTRIAFASSNEIYVMNADGTGRTNITNSPDDETGPSWAPSGAKIAFLTTGERGTDIYVINTDGTGRTNLTGYPASYLGLAWSPDGAKIAFATDRDIHGSVSSQVPETQSEDKKLPQPKAIESDIYVMNADGTGQTRLTFDQAVDGSPTWSPDGSRIAFQSDRDGNHEIYVVSVDGADLIRLTDNTQADVLPAWSPDGRYIAFAAFTDTEFQSEFDGSWDIYLMSPDGAERLNLTDTYGLDFTRPYWSPDGRYLAFEGRDANIMKTGNNEIYAMRMEGEYEYVALTENKTGDADLYVGPVVWSPDSKSIAFLYRKAGAHRVRVATVVKE